MGNKSSQLPCSQTKLSDGEFYQPRSVTIDRASDRSRKKKSNFAGFLGQNRGKITCFHGNFARIFGVNLHWLESNR